VLLPHLAAPDRSVRTPGSKPSLRAGDDRCPLEPGVYGLGGRAADAIPLAALASQPRAAILTVSEDRVVTLQRMTAAIVVRINEETVGVGPVELRSGARIEFGSCRLVFECDASTAPDSWNGTGERPANRATTEGARVLPMGVSGRFRSGVSAQTSRPADVDQGASAALVNVRTGARHALPARRVLIGRDDSCDVVVLGNSVSRRHASIVPVAGGFMLRDESANGTLVNGVRVVGTYLLGSGDVVRVQDEELRVELDSSAPVSGPRGEMTTQLNLSHITKGATEEEARAAANRTVSASLEIVRGQFSGACFQVERAVCSIGRGDENDVRIRDDTISLSHATLLLKRGAWFVADLRSMNGTFVNGSRVSGERELHTGACLRLGGVELVFRAIDAAPTRAAEPSRPGLWTRFKSWLRGIAPPS
jgi:pSer/pThr/pTyr-binding forkhead associated (FHA) protein